MNASMLEPTACIPSSEQRRAERAGSRRYDAVAKKLRLLVSVGLLSWLAWRIEWERIQEAFTQLRVEWWLAAVGVYFIAQLVSARRWQLLARPLGFRESFRHFTAFYFIGMYFNLLLPTSVGGDVVRAWCLDGKTHRRMPAFLSVLLDRLSGLFILVQLACVGISVCPVDLPSWITIGVWSIAGGGVCAMLAVPLVSRAFTHHAPLRRLADALRYYWRHPRVVLWTSMLSIGVQLANVVLVWLAGLALGLDVPFSYYAVFVPLVTLLTLLPVSLNGMGIREGGTVLFLAQVGVNDGAALCLAVLWFFALTAVSLCGGVVYFFDWFPQSEVTNSHETLGRDSDQGRAGQSAAAA